MLFYKPVNKHLETEFTSESYLSVVLKLKNKLDNLCLVTKSVYLHYFHANSVENSDFYYTIAHIHNSDIYFTTYK